MGDASGITGQAQGASSRLQRRSTSGEKRFELECSDCPVLANALFQRLSAAPDAPLSCLFQRAHFRKNQILFFEGGQADHLFALNAGLVKLVKSLDHGRERIIRLLFPGDLFGLEALGESRYPLTAVVLEDAEICSVPCGQFFAFLRENPETSAEMIRLLLGELGQIRRQMITMSFKGAPARLAMFLVSLVPQNRPDPGQPIALSLPLKSHEVGEILELSAETVSRSWRNLQERGLIEKRGRRLIVRDLPGLEAAARG